MKIQIKMIVSLVMTFAILFTAMFSASAAPSRVTGKTKYLSEVALIEASNREEADKILAELKQESKGAFEGMIELDLNEGGKKQVYLAYKTSTNVDDAITDLSVMNMNGNFTMGNYEQVFQETLEGHMEVARDYRVMAAQFKANYEKGTRNALTAYRQLNYYYRENEDGTKTYMGDYVLNFPTDDEDFAEMLFCGNLNIIANIRMLIAMGMSDPDDKLTERVNLAYASISSEIYENAAYEAGAKAILESVVQMKKVINNAQDEIDALEDEDIDDELKDFFADSKKIALDEAKAFLELLKLIKMDDTTLGDYIMNTAVIEAETFYPMVSVATDAERLLMEYGSVYDLLLYEELSLGEAALDEALAELEEEYEPISVYHGVQNDLAEGTIGVTGDAEMYSNTSGKNFLGIFTDPNSQAKSILFTAMGAGGVGLMVGGIAYLAVKQSAANANAANYAVLSAALDTAKTKAATLKGQMEMSAKLYNDAVLTESSDEVLDSMYKTYLDDLCAHNGAKQEVTKATNALNAANSNVALTTKQIIFGSTMIIAGVVMLGVSIWQLTKIYNKYEVAYTDIPDNMVHVVSTEENGERFINYINVPAYYYNDGKLKSRENDLNAYKGNQWVSLYYTKNYEAGYCLTATPDLIATESARKGYSGIHLFGRTSNYNLNSYCNRKDAAPIYLAFKYSTNQKSAVTDVPDIIGSIFSKGAFGFAAVAGFGLGMGVMGLIKRKKESSSNDVA